MSGICGIFNESGLDELDISSIKKMTSMMGHRGRDDSGGHLNSKAALGHRRQRIVDIEGGAQPMSNEDGSVWVVFDGEIYNYADLRNYLEKKGHSFRSHSDTEAILHCYEEYGDEFVPKLRGMFALAIWDNNLGVLLLARDRAGERPLYYTRAQGRFLFASEIKSLLAHPSVPRRFNPLSMHHLLTFQHVPGDATMFRDICKLPPAHLMIVGEKPEAPKSFWFPQRIRIERKNVARAESGKLAELLRGAVDRGMSGDVPIGAFLTGGLDSSAVAGLMSSLNPEKTKTFSLVYEHQTQDESGFPRLVAEHFRTDHHEFKVSDEELISSIPTLLWHYDEPMPDASILPAYALCCRAGDFVKAALSGDGGDVLFGGYERYVADRYLHYLGFIPPGVRKNVVSPVFSMASHSTTPGTTQKLFEQMASISPMSDAERHLSWISFFLHYEKMQLYTPELARELRPIVSSDILQHLYDTLEQPKTNLSTARLRGFTEQQLLLDFLTYLPETRLMRMDRASAAAGIEIRSPFLDKDVVELALSLPSDLKLKGTTTKRVLKRAMWNFLPTEVLYRHEKSLDVPLDRWFRGPLRAPARDLLLGDTARSRGLFNPAHIERLIREHDTGIRENGNRLWILLNIELWHRLFIDGDLPSEPVSLL